MSLVAPAVTVVGLNYRPEPTGIAPYTAAMATGLANRGIPVRAVTAHPHYPQWRISAGYGQWSRNELLDGVDLTRVRHHVPNPPTGIRRLYSELTFGVRSVTSRWKRPAAVVLVSPALFASCLALLRARMLNRDAAVAVWVQDLYSLGLTETAQGSGLVGRIVSAAEGWLLRHADRVVVIHDRFARRVTADFGIPPEKISVVRNWTHLPPAPETDRAAARAAHGWGDETVVLHAGAMGVKQGLDNVIDAARAADSRGADIRFVLLGSGGERDRLRAAAAGIERVQFIDPLPDADFAHALAAADVLLVNEKPGVAEMAVPSKLTSYFSTGRPVLAATDPDGITAEELRAASAGITVAAGNPEALLDAAIELGLDTHRADRLGASGKAYRESVLDESVAIDSFASLLEALIDDRRAGRRNAPATSN